MYKKYFGGVITSGSERDSFDDEIENLWNETLKEVNEQMDIVQFSKALEGIWKFISRINILMRLCLGLLLKMKLKKIDQQQ